MRYTTKRNGKNVIPLLNAVCGLDMPYWKIDRHDSLHRYLSGDAVDKLAAYEDIEERGRLVARDVLGRPYYDRPQTNADRIRAMTDEELAEYLFNRGNCSEYCYGICAYQDECDGSDHAQEFCIEQIVKWLKQEAEE